MKKYGDMSMGHEMPKQPLSTNGGKDPATKRLAKHPIKSGFFTKKTMKGDC